MEEERPRLLSKTLWHIGLVIALLLMTYLYLNERNIRIEQETLIEASMSEIEVWRGKNGESIAKIQVLETSNKKAFLNLQTKDSTILDLQELVRINRKLFNDAKAAAAIIKSQTTIDTTTATVVTIDSVSNTPIYTANIKNKWYEANTVATKDSTTIKLTTVHNLSLVIGTESQGLFKKRKTVAIVQDDNPYSEIKDMRVYNVTQSKKRFVVGPYIGMGITGTSINWSVGLGVTYKLIEF
jgi:hypothetical protein